MPRRMKTRLGVLACATLLGCGSAIIRAHPELERAPEIYWMGIDYSRTLMVGVGAFNDPDEIFPGYLDKWNGLFVEEEIDHLRAVLGKPVRADVESVMDKNERASGEQIVESTGIQGKNVTDETVDELVRGYRGESDGIGLVFIVDVMLKHREIACLYPTFFDLRSREVIDSQRHCYRTGGIGFRNYWFNPIKAAVAAL
jgi:hypothetical protein